MSSEREDAQREAPLEERPLRAQAARLGELLGVPLLLWDECSAARELEERGSDGAVFLVESDGEAPAIYTNLGGLIMRDTKAMAREEPVPLNVCCVNSLR